MRENRVSEAVGVSHADSLQNFVRRMVPDDVSCVVQVHIESFPGFFLTSLGPRFLHLFYKAVVNDANSIALVAERDRAIVGFVCGSTAPCGFYRRVLRSQWWKFGWAALGAVVRKPAMLRHLSGAVRSRVLENDTEPRAELMSLAIAPHAQHHGIGTDLVMQFLAEARRMGCSRVSLTTDRHANEAVNCFYSRLGFCLARSFVTNTGREMNLYEIDNMGQFQRD